MEKPDALYCIGQKAFIEKDGKILILHDPIEGLDFPGGKVQEGESDFMEALKREVHEETGLEITIGQPYFTWVNVYSARHRNAGKRVFLVAFRCTYVSGDVVLSDEHDSCRWVDKSNYKELDDRSQYFEALQRYFA